MAHNTVTWLFSEPGLRILFFILVPRGDPEKNVGVDNDEFHFSIKYAMSQFERGFHFP